MAAWIRGLEDVAPAIILMLGIGMLLYAARLPQVAAAVTPLIAAVAPRTPLAYVIVFGLLSPLALYRGPLNVFGVGIAVFTVLATMHALPPVALVAAVMAVVQVQNVCDPTNTQNVWIANFTGVGVDRITRLTLPYQVTVATAAVSAVVVFGAALFGSAPFAVGLPAAAAEPSGLTVAPRAALVIAVMPSDPAAMAAADIVRTAIDRGWHGYRTVSTAVDPAAGDCGTKEYAAVLRVSVDADGASREVGIELLDCGGWSVDQWHVTGTNVTQLALAALFRVHLWMHDRPGLAASVFGRGLAYDPADGPTYFYTLFKPSDGYMRALVRPGGPAYVAGLRTGDVIDKLDGRYWWEYGTYQTEQRAYDGKPHVYDVERGGVGGRPVHVVLGAPFRG
jgi:S1-C subfamily serine protease